MQNNKIYINKMDFILILLVNNNHFNLNKNNIVIFITIYYKFKL